MSSTRWPMRALAIAAIAAPVPTVAQDKPPAPPQVYTAATVTRSIRPDLAVITVRFSAEGESPIEAGASLALRADSLRRALQSLGIPRDSLISGSQWYWWRGRVEAHPHSKCLPVRLPRPTGPQCDVWNDTTYTVNDAIEIHIRDLSRVGAVIDSALAHRILDISGVSFRATDLSGVQDEALGEATRRARRQAEAIAAASGATLGRIISLSTQRESAEEPYFIGVTSASFSGGGMNGGAGTTVVQPSLPVSVTVFGKWELVVKP